MADLSTKYMGLELSNPVVVGSSSLANSVDGVKKLEDAGAAAVVLKSLFEEQIIAETEELGEYSHNLYDSEAAEFIGAYGREFGPRDYIKLIQDTKKACSIPIIASLNCFSRKWWVNYAKKIEAAGADALELNIGVIPSNTKVTSEEVESLYLGVVKDVKKEVKIPVALKIGPYFSSFANLALTLSRGRVEHRDFIVGWCGSPAPGDKKGGWDGVDALVLFNRYYQLDIDTNEMELVPGNPYSSSNEIHESLRWITLLSGRVDCDLAATTGVHTADDAVKQILAGADVVQVCSVLYQQGLEQIEIIKKGLEDWMGTHGFNSITDFRGKLSQKKSEYPTAHERLQYIKLFVGIE
jgi:dihydroorotate dehydrogenase (fumarate)